MVIPQNDAKDASWIFEIERMVIFRKNHDVGCFELVKKYGTYGTYWKVLGSSSHFRIGI